MKLVIDLSSNTIAGGTDDPAFAPTSQQVLIDAPEDFDMSSASEWSFDGVGVSRDPVAALDRAKAARKVRIKGDAARLIDATTWRLDRAREQEAAGWATLAGIDAVLAERESIRRSSSAAEDAVDAMTDIASVQNFTWSIDVSVAAPRRLTQTQFLDRFTDAEATAVLTASDSNAALRLFWQKMMMADWINLDDPATQGGVNALEIAGLLDSGRAAIVLT
jgi:hypothetical protein